MAGRSYTMKRKFYQDNYIPAQAVTITAIKTYPQTQTKYFYKEHPKAKVDFETILKLADFRFR